VTLTEPEVLSVSSSVVNVSCPGVPDGSITLTITGGTGPYSVIWADGFTFVNREELTEGTYSAIVTDANGCAASIDVEVGITGSDACLVVPTIITPNSDGYNDTWRIRNIELFPDAEVQIFNRWGQRVFETKNPSANPWDGTFKGKELPTDSYHYILDLHDGSDPRSGVLSIMR
jgi:gliding motility-associated-like protein